MAYKVLLRLSCEHLLTIHDVRETPDHVVCPLCGEHRQVIDSVDSQPLTRRDNGRTF